MSCRFATVTTVAAVAGLAFIGGRMSTSYEGNTVNAAEQPAVGVPLSAEHKRLEAMVGDWKGTVKILMGGMWSEMDTTITREKAMDGLFIIEHVKSTSVMGEYRGMGIVGYDTNEKEYQGVWIENMSPSMSHSAGTYDEATGVWTFHGEMVDPVSGAKFKSISTVDTSEADTQVMEGYIIMPDGAKQKNFEATFNRD